MDSLGQPPARIENAKGGSRTQECHDPMQYQRSLLVAVSIASVFGFPACQDDHEPQQSFAIREATAGPRKPSRVYGDVVRVADQDPQPTATIVKRAEPTGDVRPSSVPDDKSQFEGLPVAVQALLKQAARKQIIPYERSDLPSLRYDEKAAAQLDQSWRCFLKERREASDVEANATESIIQSHLKAGTVRLWDTSESYYKADLNLGMQKDGTLRVPVEGEVSIKGQPPKMSYGVVTIDLDRHLELKRAIDYLAGFEQYRQSILDRTPALILRQ